MPRVTADEKTATRERIVAAACKLFRQKGFEQATTREIARRAGIASGTLFNYFPTKEALVTALVAEDFGRAASDFARRRRAGADLEEDLFLHVSTTLRRLKPHRKYLAPVLETSLSPLTSGGLGDAGGAIRVNHLEAVVRIMADHGCPPPSQLGLQLYWTLVTGLLAFWVADASPRQEDTLAMLDQSISMFVGWLPTDGGGAGETQSTNERWDG